MVEFYKFPMYTEHVSHVLNQYRRDRKEVGGLAPSFRAAFHEGNCEQRALYTKFHYNTVTGSAMPSIKSNVSLHTLL